MSAFDDLFQKLPDIARTYVAENALDEVECIVGDIAGIARGKAMPGEEIRP